ncbi:MAG: glycoside hydrolase family 38 C-terminal domain-containing protein [Candidatus Merdivicinus sp.]|jgi:alpha-mannosidase
MYFPKERAEIITKELANLITVQNHPISAFEMKEGFFVNPAEADADPAAYQNFCCETDHWDGPDAHYWFRTELEVPESFDGKPLWLYFCTQKVYWDAVNPQFLLFLNGEPVQGVDINHREVLVTRNAKAGEKYRLDLQAYTGRDTNEHAGESFKLELHASYLERSAEIERLYYNLAIPAEIIGWLDKESLSSIKLAEALNETVNRIDLREPYSKEFYASVEEANQYVEQAIYTELAGNDDVIATCIGHTHIDVAWWWTVAQTREKAARSFATVLKLMDEYPEYKFMSSQPQLYAFVKERYPEMFEKIKQRVAEGRWEVEGGMWLEADCNLISGESMVRQFLHGKKFFRDEFGKDNKILWLPDVFGYSAALPQILHGCGIDYFMTTKIAWNQFNKLPMDTFWWKGIDGSEVFTHLITTQDAHQPKDSHYTTYNGFLNATSVIRAWERYQQKEFANDVLLSCGYGDGGGGTTRPMAENAKRLAKGLTGVPKVRWEFSRNYFDQLFEKCGKNEKLPHWVGELYLEYHRGTYTSMARNKKANRKSELLWQEAEFFANWAKDLGTEYPAEEFFKSWENILLNQFHDILPGSSIHDVYEVTKVEYADLISRANKLIGDRVQLLADHTGADIGDLVVFNAAPFDRDAVICVAAGVDALEDESGCRYPVQKTENGGICRIAGIPAKGWKAFKTVSKAEETSPFIFADDGIETPFYQIRWNQNGFFTSVFDKEADRELLKAGKLGNVLRAYEDKPMKYDNWDIDIYYTEKSWLVDDVQSMEWIEKGPVRATLRIERKFLQSTIIQNIRFYADSRNIDFETYIDWKQHQVLLKAEFDVDINANEATYDIQFGNLTRPTHSNTMWDVAKFEVCAHKWADLSESGYGVALLNDCKYGHAIHEGHMSITLLKSGILPNPVTDQEEHTFTYALLPHIGDWRGGHVPEAAYALNIPVRTAVVSAKGEGLASQYVSVSAGNVALETVKQALEGSDTILRMYEYRNCRGPVTVTLADPAERVWECDMLENPIREMETDGHCFSFTIKPYEVKTFRILSK